MRRKWKMRLDHVEKWPNWFRTQSYKVRLFRDDQTAARELKARIDSMFWADEFIDGRLNGVIEDVDETVLVQVREHISADRPVDMVSVFIWPIPFEKGKRRPDKENLWKKVMAEFEDHGLTGD
jgi:hypothetical protein